MKIETQMPAVVVLCIFCLVGCAENPTEGYTLADQYPSDVKTVAVPVWMRGKDVYRCGLEQRLSEALVKRIESTTPYKVTTKGRADTLLVGTIDRVHQRVLGTNPDTGLPRELELTIAVSFTWKDLRRGENIVELRNLRLTGTYIPSEPLAEEFFQGSEDVIDQLAGRIVEKMEADW